MSSYNNLEIYIVTYLFNELWKPKKKAFFDNLMLVITKLNSGLRYFLYFDLSIHAGGKIVFGSNFRERFIFEWDFDGFTHFEVP